MIAARLVADGHIVYGSSRKVSSSMPDGVIPVRLDVCSEESVETCIRSIVEKSERLDVLVNNAGILHVGAIEETSVEEAKHQFETNFFGVVRTTRAVLAAMRKQGAGKIIVTGSLAGLAGVPYEGFYSASKHALEGYCETLSFELHGSGISVSLMEPGFMATAIGESAVTPKSKLALHDAGRNAFLKSLENSIGHGSPPELVADTVVEIVAAKSPKLRYRIGKDAAWVPRFKAIAPWSFYRSQILRKFVSVSRGKF